jgi:hypothetical protein
MTRIEKAVKLVSDLYDFYRQIPKISERDLVRQEKHNRAPQRNGRKLTSRLSKIS